MTISVEPTKLITILEVIVTCIMSYFDNNEERGINSSGNPLSVFITIKFYEASMGFGLIYAGRKRFFLH